MSPLEAADLVRAGLARSDRVFWLDGGGAGVTGRSLVGVLEDDDVSLTFDARRREVRRHRGASDSVVGEDVFEVLADELASDAGDASVHWVGFLGYAARTDLAARPWGAGPDAVWMRCRAPVVVPTPPTPAPPVPAPPSLPVAAPGPVPGWYADAFARVQEELRAGNTYEVNLTHREPVPRLTDPWAAYLRLRSSNPAPYAGLLHHRGTWLLSSSPERYATVDADRWIETRPIKGTSPRDPDPVADEALRAGLAADPKCRAENLMVLDLLRHDLAQVCEVGSVEVPRLMEVESYPSVHQLVSTVRGRLRDDVATVAALRTLFPAGSMTGAPKKRTMEIIDRVETSPRGPYAGAFGWISADGRADLGVVIRSLFAGPDGDWALGTGGGVTVRSDVAAEWAEAGWKAERLRPPADPA